MSKFKREERYLVVKLKNFNPWQRDNLKENFGRDAVKAVVVEFDWPIYEETWENIQRWVEGRRSIKTELADLREENEQLKFLSDCQKEQITRLQSYTSRDYKHIKKLNARVAELEKNALDLCDAVENKQDFPPAKFALRCLMIINRIRKVGPFKEPSNEFNED